MVYLQKDTYLSFSNTSPQAGAYTTTTKPQWDRLSSLNRLVRVNHMYSFLEKHLQNMIKKILIVAAGRDTSPTVYFQKDTILSLSNTPSSWSIQQQPSVSLKIFMINYRFLTGTCTFFEEQHKVNWSQQMMEDQQIERMMEGGRGARVVGCRYLVYTCYGPRAFSGNNFVKGIGKVRKIRNSELKKR